MSTLLKFAYINIIILSIANFSYANDNGTESEISNLNHVSPTALIRAENKILIISTRHFTDPLSLTFEKGVHPQNKLFFFIVGSSGDSTIVTNYSTLSEAMMHLNKEKDMLVYVNGYGKTFNGTVKGGQKLGKRYNVNIVMYDWPTDQRPIRITARNARKVSNNLALSLNEIGRVNKKSFQNSRLSVVFHSMGNHVARHLVESGSINLISENTIDNIILNAAAVKSYDHDQWVEQLKHKEEVYIVINKNDYVLRGASLVRGARQLGNVALGELADNANYIDFSGIAEKEHGYYLGVSQAEKNNPKLFEFYNTVFQGLDFNKNTDNYLVAEQ